jgi:hypothetical protein
VILALCAGVYLALPIVVASRSWRGGRCLQAVSSLIAYVVRPVLVGFALQALDARLPPARESCDAADKVVNAALIDLGACWGFAPSRWLAGRPHPKP